MQKDQHVDISLEYTIIFTLIAAIAAKRKTKTKPNTKFKKWTKKIYILVLESQASSDKKAIDEWCGNRIISIKNYSF